MSSSRSWADTLRSSILEISFPENYQLAAMSLKETCAYLLNVLADNEKPTEACLTKTLKSVGCNIDAANIKLVIQSCEGKTASQLIAKGLSNLSASGGAAQPRAPGASGKSPKKSPEAGPKVVEEEVEEDVGGFSLFD
jgi:ribosomal protein L12E/L44/L45/RPP1/RPP2